MLRRMHHIDELIEQIDEEDKDEGLKLTRTVSEVFSKDDTDLEFKKQKTSIEKVLEYRDAWHKCDANKQPTPPPTPKIRGTIYEQLEEIKKKFYGY